MGPPRMFLVDSDLTRNPPNVVLENEEKLLLPKQQVFAALDHRVRGFPSYPETPRFRYLKGRGRALSDIETISDYWLVSERTRTVFTEVDAAGFAFVRCEVVSASGEPDPQVYWLCDAVRVIDLLDEGLSNVRVRHDGRGKFYRLMGATTFAFRLPPPSVHVFRMRYAEGQAVCDAHLRDACRAAKLRGFRFTACETSLDASGPTS